ncbi:MAG: flavodoxin family protein, partial [Armatimonadota bacterium]
MLVIGLQSSPNEDGLTATAAQAALEGARKAGAETELIHLRQKDIQACRACDDGWGRCAREGLCIIEDDMQALRERLYEADALVLSTPVYFGEVSEVTKSFLDRVRRCERRMEQPSPLEGMAILCIAAAGGSGGGTVSCMDMLQRYCSHLHLRMFDNLPLMRRSREYVLAALPEAGKALVGFAEE